MNIITDAIHASPGSAKRTRAGAYGSPRLKALPLSLALALAAASMFGGNALAIDVATGVVSVNPLTSPTGGSVVGGLGSISQDGANTVINQVSNRLALNWQTFNVGKDATVLFKQPSLTAVALNRILDQNPSQIFGHINSNGQVFLINTHGIIFGSSAQVNVGGLVASTLDLTPTDFLANHFNLDAHGGNAGVVNHGTIDAASGGSVSLVGGSVANDGLILANYGKINLDGADRAVLDFDGNGLINIQVTGALKQRLDAKAAVSNDGTLQADGGTVVLQAAAAKDLFTNLVNNSGVITAGGISTDGGTVRLVAAGGNAISSGSINVSGVHGGSAQVLSDANVGVTGTIDASGTQGGGSIRVGGGYQGGEGLTTAKVTYLGADARLNADATVQGDGGSVVLWGDQGNNFFGDISARGGALGGNGGLVETSAHYGLNAQGSVDASALHGEAGNWLIDPYNITIDATGGTLASPFTATADSSITAGNVSAALTGTTVSIFTGTSGTSNGDITVNAPITATSGTGNALYLKAAGGIFLNSAISSDSINAMDVHLWSNYGGAAGDTSYTSNASCAALVSCVVAIGDTANGSVTTTGGLVDIQTGTGGGALLLGSATNTGVIDAGTGALTVNTTGISQGSLAGSTLTAGNATLNAGAGVIALGFSANNLSGTVTLSKSAANNASLNNGTHALTLGASSIGGNLAVSAGGGIQLDGNITTGLAQIYSNAVTLGANVTLTAGSNVVLVTVDNASTTARDFTVSAGTGNVTFSGAVGADPTNGALGALVVNSTGVTTFGSSVAATSLTTDAGGSTALGGNVTTSAAQTYNDAVTLGVDTTLASSGGAIGLLSTVDGAHALSVNTSGATSFGGVVGGSTALTSLTTDAGGSTSLGGNVSTSAAQTYNDTVTLSADSSLSGSAMGFAGTVDGAHALTVNTTGALAFGGQVGSNTALTSLTSTSGTLSVKSLNIDTGGLSLTTTGGDIVQGGTFTVAGTSNFDAATGAITLSTASNALTGAVSLTGANVSLVNNQATVLGAGTVTGTFDVTTKGALTQTGALNVAGAATFTQNSKTAGTSQDVLLDNGSNVFSGAVKIAKGGGGTAVNNLSLTNTSATVGTLTLPTNVLGDLTLNYTNAALTVPTVNVTGALDVSAGGGITIASNVSTGGAQTYRDAVVLGANATLASTNGGAIGLLSTVDGVHALTVNTSGATSFGGVIGGTTALTSLTTNAGGSTTLSGNVTTSGAQTYNDAVALGADTTLASTGGGAIRLLSTVDGVRALTVNTSGATTFGGVVGGSMALTSMTTDAAGSTVLSGDITTTGAQTYNDAVTLSGNVILASTGGGTIGLLSTLDGARTLAVNTAGATTFGGVVGGSTALASLSTDATGTTSLGGNVTTTGAQTYSDALKLAADATLSTSNSTVSSNNTLDNAAPTARNLTVSAGSGDVIFAGAVGADAINGPLASLVVNSTGATSFGSSVAAASVTTDANGSTSLSGNVTTTGAQTYNDAVTLGANATLASTGSGTIGFVSTLDGAHNLTVNTGGMASFGGAAGSGAALNQLSVTSGTFSANALTVGAGGLALTTSTGIAQSGAFTVAGTSSFNAGVNAITLTNAANTFTGAVSLTGGNVSLVNNAATVLGTSTVGGTLSVDSNGALTQTGALTVTNLATFTQNSASAGASQDISLGAQSNDFKGTATFAGTINNLSLKNIDAIPGTLTLPASVAGNFTLNYTSAAVTVPAVSVAGALDVGAGGGITIGSSVSTGGAQTYRNVVTLGGGTTLTSTGGGVIDLQSTVDGAQALTINTSGATSFGGAVGGTTALTSLTTNAGGSTMLGGNVTTSGAQTYNDAVTLGANVTLATTNSAVLFGSTVDNTSSTARDLTVSAGTGNVTFTGAVGSDLTNGALGALTVYSTGATSFGGSVAATSLTTDAGGGTTLGGNVTTSAAQSYNDAVTLGADATLNGSAVSFAATLEGAHALNVTTTGALTFGAAVGGGTALTSLTSSSGSLGAQALSIGSGGLSLTTTAGNIAQGGAFTVAGTSAFHAGTNAITLTNAANAFTGAISLTGGNVSLVNNAATVLGAGTVAGTLDVASNGALSEAGGLGVTGAATFTQNSTTSGTTQDVLLGNTSNVFNGAVTIEAGTGAAVNNLSLTNAAATPGVLTLPASITGNLTLNYVNAALTVPTVSVAGALDVSAGGGITIANSISTAGAQTYRSAVTLGADTTLASTGGGVIDLQSTVDGAQALVVNTSGGTTLGGAVGGTTALTGLQVNSGTLAINGNLTAGAMTLNSGGNIALGHNLSTGVLSLISGGNISQSAGVITASSLTGQSTGSTTLGGANQIAALGNFGAMNFSLTDAQALAVNGTLTVPGTLSLTTTSGALTLSGALSATTLSLASAADLALSNNLTASTLSLSSGSNISQSAGVITAGTLTGSSTASTTLGGANQIAVLGNFSAANFSLTDGQALAVNGTLTVPGTLSLTTTSGALTLSGGLSATTLSLSSAADLGLSSNLTATTLSLSSGGNISQSAGVITAGTLTGSSTGNTTLGGANLVGTLGAFSAANFSLSNAQALAVSGTLAVPGTLSLTTASGALTLNGDLSANALSLTSATDLALSHNLTASSLTLGAGGAISQSAGVITAGTLTGSSTGNTTLGGANLIGTLGAFNAANFSLTNAQALTVNGVITTTGGTGSIGLTTTSGALTILQNIAGGAITLDSAANLALSNNITGSNVTLASGGNISQGGGKITATALSGSSVGSTALNGANAVGSLGNFTAAGFSLTDGAGLTVAGTVDGGSSTTLTTTSGNLAVNGNIKGTTTTLTSAGAIGEGGSGVVTAGTLTGSSVGDTTLNGANQIGTLGAFSAANLSLTDAHALIVSGPLNVTGNLSLTTTVGGLTLGGDLSAQSITLDSKADLALSHNLTATALSLNSGGNITQSGGVLTASTLTGASTGDTTLNGANRIGTMGAFSAANFSLTNAQALAVNGLLTTTGGTGSIQLTTTSGALNVSQSLSGGAISLSSVKDLALSTNVTSQSLDLVSGGNITQSGGVLTAGTLTGSSTGSTALTGANQIASLGTFSTGTGFSLNDARALTVAGNVTGGTGPVSIQTSSGTLTVDGTLTGASLDLGGHNGLAINASLDSGSGSTQLTSAAGSISEGSGGSVTADSLVATAAGSITLAGANQVATLGSLSSGGDISFNDTRTLTVTSPSPLDANGGAGNLTLTTTGANSDLVLAADITAHNVVIGAGRDIKQVGTGITAVTLSGQSGGNTVLSGANHIGTLGVFSATNFSLSNAQALALNGPLTTGNLGDISVATTSGALVVNASLAGNTIDLSAAGDLALGSAVKAHSVTLTSGGAITQGNAGSIVADMLSGQSVGSTTLDQANQIGTLDSFRAAGFHFSNAATLTVAGPIDGGNAVSLATTAGSLTLNGAVNGITTTLQAAGNLTEGSGGSVAAATLTGHSGGATALLGTNHIGTLGSFSAAGFALSNAQALTVAGPLDGGASTGLTTTAGDLSIGGAVSGAVTSLTSAGAITEGSGGVITAGTLSGSATGITSLGTSAHPIANFVGTLGNFSSTAGFSLTNGQTLKLASVDGSAFSVDAGTASLYLAVANGDLLQSGQTPLYDGIGTFSSTGKIGSPVDPIYVIGTGNQTVAKVGTPPAYFYAVDRQGNILPLVGDLSVNVPTSLFTSKAQNSNNRGDSYIDSSVISANYRSFGIVPSGILLPPDQQQCQPELEDCPLD